MIIQATPYAAEWQIGVMIAAAVFLFLYQAQPVSRRRLIATVLLLVCAVGCVAVFAEPQQPVNNICKDLEPYSPPWWLYGCWGLPDGR